MRGEHSGQRTWQVQRAWGRSVLGLPEECVAEQCDPAGAQPEERSHGRSQMAPSYLVAAGLGPGERQPSHSVQASNRLGEAHPH